MSVHLQELQQVEVFFFPFSDEERTLLFAWKRERSPSLNLLVFAEAFRRRSGE